MSCDLQKKNNVTWILLRPHLWNREEGLHNQEDHAYLHESNVLGCHPDNGDLCPCHDLSAE